MEEKNKGTLSVKLISRNTKILVANWLNIFSKSWDSSSNDKISKELLNKIESDFGELLLLAGIPKEEECEIKVEPKSYGFLKCHLKKSNKNVLLQLLNGDLLDYGPEIIITDGLIKKRFEYLSNSNFGNVLQLNRYTSLDEKKPIELNRYFGYYDYCLDLTNEKYTIKLSLEPIDMSKFISSKEETNLQNLLINLSVPIDIKEIYKKITSSLAGKFKSLSIKQMEGCDEIDSIEVKNNDIVRFRITSNGKTVEVYKDGWQYQNSEGSIHEYKNGEIDYSVKVLPKEDFKKLNPREYYDEATKEVEKVKILVKSL